MGLISKIADIASEYVFGKRVNVKVFYTNASSVKLTALPISEVKDKAGNSVHKINIHSIYVESNGKNPAYNVRVPVNTLAGIEYEVQTHAHYFMEPINDPNSECVHFVFPRLVSGQSALLTFVYLPTLNFTQLHQAVSHDGGFAVQENVLFAPRVGRWKIWLFNLIFALGLIALVVAVFVAYEKVKPHVEQLMNIS